jgi:hypothetical protein
MAGSAAKPAWNSSSESDPLWLKGSVTKLMMVARYGEVVVEYLVRVEPEEDLFDDLLGVGLGVVGERASLGHLRNAHEHGLHLRYRKLPIPVLIEHPERRYTNKGYHQHTRLHDDTK